MPDAKGEEKYWCNTPLEPVSDRKLASLVCKVVKIYLKGCSFDTKYFALRALELLDRH